MIKLTCTACDNRLEIDDAFAGGVCRCKFCGTIQTVPAAPLAEEIADEPDAGSAFARVLHTPGTREPLGPVGSGLDELDEVITSSGLTRRTNRARQTPRPTPAEPQTKRGKLVALGVAAAVLVGAGGLLAWSLGGGEDEGPAAVMGLAVDGEGPVVILLDHGRSTAEFGRPLETAVRRSVFNLKDRPAQVVLATGAGPEVAFPGGPTPPDLDATGRVDTLLSTRPSVTGDLPASFDEAFDQAGPGGDIVFVTGRAWQLEPSAVLDLTTLARDAGVRVHTVALGGDHPDGLLARLAAETGGLATTPDRLALNQLQ